MTGNTWKGIGKTAPNATFLKFVYNCNITVQKKASVASPAPECKYVPLLINKVYKIKHGTIGLGKVMNIYWF